MDSTLDIETADTFDPSAAPPPRADDPAPLGYAGFGPRLLANVVDVFVIVPVATLAWWTLSFHRAASLALWVPLDLLGVAYTIIMHAYRGQTLGKLVARIRVVRLTGERIGWRQAILRSSIDIAFVVAGSAASLSAASQLSAASWTEGPLVLTTQLQAIEPTWMRAIALGSQLWFWSEIIVLLSNAKRRAAHDFIAGTVVVKSVNRAE